MRFAEQHSLPENEHDGELGEPWQSLKYNVGDKVYWTDPDEGTCSGYGTVIAYKATLAEEPIYVLNMADGGDNEVFGNELS